MNAPDQKAYAASVLRDLLEEFEEGKNVGFMLISLNHDTGGASSVAINVGTAGPAYMLLHQLASKIMKKAEMDQREEMH
jgi:hypothetical protein